MTGKNSSQKSDHLCCAAMETTQVILSRPIRPTQHYESKAKLKYAVITYLPPKIEGNNVMYLLFIEGQVCHRV